MVTTSTPALRSAVLVRVLRVVADDDTRLECDHVVAVIPLLTLDAVDVACGCHNPGRHPVAEGRCEADVVAEPGSRVAVHAAVDVGFASGQCLEYEGQHQHADAGDRPTDDEWTWRGAACHLGRNAKMPLPIIDPTTRAVRATTPRPALGPLDVFLRV